MTDQTENKTPDERLSLAVSHYMSEAQLIRSRMGMVGGGSIDSKRSSSAYCEYGFPEDVDFSDFMKLYRRGGVAHGGVNKVLNKCWSTAPQIIQGDAQDNAKKVTPWENSLKKIFKGGRFWKAFKEADKRRLVGRYSALLLRIGDGGKWHEPVTKQGASLVQLVPVWQSALSITKYGTDPESEDYGQPIEWSYTEEQVEGTVDRSVKIHKDRIFVLGDWRPDAIGFLEPAFNAFVSLEKVEGGGGESFLKNAARHLSMSFDPEIDLANVAAMYNVDLKDLSGEISKVARRINRGSDVVLATQGATVTPLVSNVPDPQPVYGVNLQTISAALDIPAKILVGNQTGERASTEDQKDFSGMCQSRRESELSFEISGMMDKLIALRIVKPVPEFTVVWDKLTESTLAERLASSKTMAEINSLSVGIEGVVYPANEIREVSGHDPLGSGDDDEEGENLPRLPGDPATDPTRTAPAAPPAPPPPAAAPGA